MNYLNTGNTLRYRPILRYFYEQHGYRTQLKVEDILQHLKQFDDFDSYTIDELKKDLDVLESWKNITTRQEANDYYTIEEFKSKRFKYQATHYTIQIERFLETLETSKADFGGGSLDKTLFDRIMEALKQLHAIEVSIEPEEVYRRWEDLMEYFRRLDRKTSDYLAHISSFQAEDEMLSEAFLVRRQDLLNYLRDFVLVLQKKIPQLQHMIEEKFHEEWIGEIIEMVATYQLTIFRFGEKVSPEAVKKRLRDEWTSMFMWFCGEESDAKSVMTQTGEIIRKMLRFASRLMESKQYLRSRKQEFWDLARHFYELGNDEKAHELASLVIGVSHTKHFACDENDNSGRIESFWDIDQEPIELGSRKPGFRSKGKISGIANNRAQQNEMLEEYMRQQEEIKQNFLMLIQNNKIELEKLPVLTRPQRQKILELVNRCLHASEHIGRTEWGHTFKWAPGDGSVKVQCLDGELVMPNGSLLLQNLSKGASAV
ncbi:TIGR02677 family protein [Paenibacillus sp. yr247]|uniref:TIGR02677 family protein n=1 Tax=Paenibacillus sp. yr247 TaxID=1761880 RepID=UPI001587BAFE|nr:TIGR02677 family protein [Paenibacillus sp. yr247]